MRSNSRPNIGTGVIYKYRLFPLFHFFLSSFLVAESAAVRPCFLHAGSPGGQYEPESLEWIVTPLGSPDSLRYFEFPYSYHLLWKTIPQEVIFLLISYLRAAFLYLVLILSVRMMGKRQIGQMEASEFVVTMLVANLASIPMQDAAIPLYSGLIPILVVLGMELTLSGLILRSVMIRRFFCGKPVILIDNGKILMENLRRTRVTLDELTGHLRQKDVLEIQTVQYAILETDGSLSVFPYPGERPATAKEAGIRAKKQYLPITIVEDGFLSEENLRKAEKDEDWLAAVLQKNRASLRDTLLLTVDPVGHVVFLRKEEA